MKDRRFPPSDPEERAAPAEKSVVAGPLPLPALILPEDTERALADWLRAASLDAGRWKAAVDHLAGILRTARASPGAANGAAGGAGAALTGLAAMGLTLAEAAVAQAVAEGLTAEEIAALRGASIHTVRNQIKAALAKTGSRRQAELATMVQRLRG